MLVGLDRLGEHEFSIRIIKIASRVERPYVPFRVTVSDPFCNDLAGTAGLRNTERERAAVIKTRQPGSRPNQGIAVGCVRDRAVDDFLDASRAEDRHAFA